MKARNTAAVGFLAALFIGLVELIALNIGYDLGILSPPIFTMLVLMALMTTGMTGPLLSLSDHLRARHALRIKPI